MKTPKSERSKRQSTADFLTAETELLAKELASLDQKIAEFKALNEGALPEQNNVSLVLQIAQSYRLMIWIFS